MPEINKVEITVTHQVSLQMLADVIITAVEGGINYWADVVAYKWTEGPEHTKAEIIDREAGDGDDPESSPKHYTIDLQVVQRGIGRALGGSILNSEIAGYIAQAVSEDDAGHIDSIAADAIVQAGLFNEIVYG